MGLTLVLCIGRSNTSIKMKNILLFALLLVALYGCTRHQPYPSKSSTSKSSGHIYWATNHMGKTPWDVRDCSLEVCSDLTSYQRKVGGIHDSIIPKEIVRNLPFPPRNASTNNRLGEYAQPFPKLP